MSEIRVDSIGNESNTGGPVLSGITEFSGQQYFIPPKGTTAERPSDCPPGSIRFNTDSAHLEYWNGSVWLEFEASSEELAGPNEGLGTRGLYLGGGSPGQSDTIDYHNLSSPGTFIDFGNLFSGRYGNTATSSRVRGIIFGGYGSNNDTVDFVTIASTGNSTDALNLSVNHKYAASWSNGTRGCVAGSYNPQINNISYVNIATLNDAKDFGDLTVARGIMQAANSSVRGIIAGGYTGSNSNIIDYVTTSTTGNALDFGDTLTTLGYAGACCNATRAVWGGSYSTAIEFLTMASTGNTIDFGDMVHTHGHRRGMSSPTRGMWAGGKTPSSPYPPQTDIDYVEIMSLGNALDFGDLSEVRSAGGATSNGHGGL